MKFVVIKKKRLLIIISAIIALIIIIGCTIGQVTGAFSKNQKRLIPIYNVETDKKQIAISFDCAWGVEYTDLILDTMKERGVKCTFYTVGFWTEKYPDYIKKIYDDGHEIGTHSNTHPYMTRLSDEKIKNELTYSIEKIENITNEKVITFRAPYGDYNNNVINVASSLGLYTIQWDVDSLDWKNLSKSQIIDRVVPKIKNGSIVLFHNNGMHTAEALPEILDTLQSQGYEFVRICDLIYKDGYTISSNGTQIKNV